MNTAPGWGHGFLEKKKAVRNTLNTLGKIREHLFGTVYVDALHQVKELIDTIEVDRTRIKPIVKITGEFWAQTTEGDGNFNMFAFLEREGAQVLPEPIATWAAYLMYQGKYNHERRKAVEEHQRQLAWWNLKDRAKLELKYAGKFAGITVGESLWRYFYHRVIRELGGLTHELIPQKQLARLAAPFYNKFARGGEGHLEVGKNVYYTVNNRVHMVLALKPFGCMPSSQSDGVQSAVINKYKDMIFLPIETSGEGEVNAHSRVQMALGEAKAKARTEFEKVLESTGKRLDDIKEYVAGHAELRRPLYHVPERPGVAGTANLSSMLAIAWTTILGLGAGRALRFRPSPQN
jgi:predicted nucleotide-binding protein (sugar kinase/HSP70/actin superfamily)